MHKNEMRAFNPLPKSPLVSICIPNYNNSKYLGEAIESALAQTYENIEIVIVDNCSTDNSWDIIRSFCYDERIIAHRSELNIGMVANFDRTRNLAKGEWIIWLCADDVLLPFTIKYLMDPILSGHKCVLSFGLVEFNVGKKEQIVAFPKGIVNGKDYRKASLTNGCNLNYLCASLFNKIDAMDISLIDNFYFDWRFWLDLTGKGDVYFTDRKLSMYRNHASNQTLEKSRNVFDQYGELKNAVLDIADTENKREALLTSLYKHQLKFILSNSEFNLAVRFTVKVKDFYFLKRTGLLMKLVLKRIYK